MAQERLNGLAAMNIKSDVEIDFDRVVDDFSRKHPRRMQFANILEEESEEE